MCESTRNGVHLGILRYYWFIRNQNWPFDFVMYSPFVEPLKTLFNVDVICIWDLGRWRKRSCDFLDIKICLHAGFKSKVMQALNSQIPYCPTNYPYRRWFPDFVFSKGVSSIRRLIPIFHKYRARKWCYNFWNITNAFQHFWQKTSKGFK